MLGIKPNLSAQVIIRNLQPESTHERPPVPTGAQRKIELEYQDWARLCARKATEHTHLRAHDRQVTSPLPGPTWFENDGRAERPGLKGLAVPALNSNCLPLVKSP
jgi:hypothetical protein